MWYPEIENEQYIGTSENFDRWTYYAHEKVNFNNAMEWVRNNQATSSLADRVEYQKEFLNHALTGFVTTHAVTIAAIIVLTYWIFRKRQGNPVGETRIVVTTKEERQEYQQEVTHKQLPQRIETALALMPAEPTTIDIPEFTAQQMEDSTPEDSPKRELPEP